MQCSNQLWNVQTGRTHTVSSTERHRALPLDIILRQVLIEHHEEIFGKPHRSTRTFAVGGFDFAEKMPCARRPVTAAPQRRALARLRVELWGSPMSAGRRTRMRSKAEFRSSNGECPSQLGRKASPIVHRLDTVLAHLLPLFSDLSDSLDHSPNAFALAQGVP